MNTMRHNVADIIDEVGNTDFAGQFINLDTMDLSAGNVYIENNVKYVDFDNWDYRTLTVRLSDGKIMSPAWDIPFDRQ